MTPEVRCVALTFDTYSSTVDLVIPRSWTTTLALDRAPVEPTIDRLHCVRQLGNRRIGRQDQRVGGWLEGRELPGFLRFSGDGRRFVARYWTYRRDFWDVDGTCLYRRQDVTVTVTVRR